MTVAQGRSDGWSWHDDRRLARPNGLAHYTGHARHPSQIFEPARMDCGGILVLSRRSLTAANAA